MSRVEVLSGPERRRRWSADQKRSIVAEAFAPGVSVCAVARRLDVPSMSFMSAGLVKTMPPPKRSSPRRQTMWQTSRKEQRNEPKGSHPGAPAWVNRPPPRAAASAMGALCDARRSLLLTTGTAAITLDAKSKY